MKDQIVILVKTIQQIKDAMCQHGEKVDQMEVEMGKMKNGFNEVIQECNKIVYVMTNTLTNNIQYGINLAQETLATIILRLNDQLDTIIVLKKDLVNGKSVFIIMMRMKIKEPKPYNGTHNAKLLGNLCWVIEEYLEQRCNDVAMMG